MTNSTPKVLIVGAGPTGLVLALRLARHGVPFRIIDRNSGPGQMSRATAVHARTLEFYQQLGLADEIVAQGVKGETTHLLEGGKEVARLSLGDIGGDLSPFPFVLAYPQDDHERFLVRQLEAAGVHVERSVVLTELSEDEHAVSALLVLGDREERASFDYVCGCDGGHSRVREAIGIDFPGGSYDQLFYVADAKVEGGFRTDVYIHLGKRSLALMMPVRSSGMQRLIGIMPPGHDPLSPASFEDVRPQVEPLIGVRVEEVNWFSTYHVHHRVAAHFRVGRCFIAGDAGHVHSPAGGQGMNTGIGDAVNLSWKLAHVLQGRADLALLDTYEPERIAFARALVATTDRAFQAMVGEGASGQILRTLLVPHLFPFLTGFSATRRAFFKALSQTRINYHASALSEGEAGDVKGGDRLPWVASVEGGNFAPLRSLDWQLHVYGAAAPSFADAARAQGVALHAFAWDAAAQKAGLKRDAAYLVRPDGYVALAMTKPDGAQLAAFAGKLGLRLRFASA